MSRSYRKTAILTDSDKQKKQAANRKHRRANKVRVQQGKEPVLMHELVNQYDVCDYKVVYEGWKSDNYTSREWIEKQKELIKRK